MHKSFVMSFSYNRKMNFFFFFSNLKKYTSPANEFLIHACGQMVKQAYIYPPLGKRYSPIVSTICGPNKGNNAYELFVILIPSTFLLNFFHIRKTWKKIGHTCFDSSIFQPFCGMRVDPNYLSLPITLSILINFFLAYHEKKSFWTIKIL